MFYFIDIINIVQSTVQCEGDYQLPHSIREFRTMITIFYTGALKKVDDIS
jgi:hypothetical protein